MDACFKGTLCCILQCLIQKQIIHFCITVTFMSQLYSMNICLGSILLGNLRSFDLAGVILKYFGGADQEAARPPSAPQDQDV